MPLSDFEYQFPDAGPGFLEQLGQGALSGLGYLGASLDKAVGGRAIRGLLGGRPEELLSIIPFSDTLGITDPENMVTGSELLGNKEADFLSPGGVGGLGLEILLDPATYLTFGGSALTKAGKAAKKLGVLPDTTAGRLAGISVADIPAEKLAAARSGLGPGADAALMEIEGKTLGGNIGFQLPFTEGAQAVGDASWIPGAIGSALRNTPLVGGKIGEGMDLLKGAGQGLWRNVIGPYFHAPYGGQPTPYLQDLYSSEIYGKMPAAMKTAREEVRPLVERGVSLYGDQFLTNKDIGRRLSDVFEGAVDPADAAEQELLGMFSALRQKNLTDKMASGYATAALPYQEIVSGPGVGRQLDYAPRFITEGSPFSKQGIQQKVAPNVEMSRTEQFRGFTKNAANQFAAEDLTGMIPGQAEEYIAAKYLGVPDIKKTLAEAEVRYTQAEATLEGIKATGFDDAMHRSAMEAAAREKNIAENLYRDVKDKAAQAKTLAKWKEAHGVIPEMFGNHPIEDLFVKVMKDKERILKAEAINKAVTDLARPAGEIAGETVPLKWVLEEANMMPPRPDFAVDAMVMPKNEAMAIIRLNKAVDQPELSKKLADIFSSVTNMTKAFQTVWAPSYHVRNQTTALWQHWVHGVFGEGTPLKAIMQPWQDASVIRAGKVIPDANTIPGLEHLSPELATEQLSREMIDNDVIHRIGKTGKQVAAQEVYAQGQRIEELLPMMPKPGLLEGVKQSWRGGDWNPLGVGGAFGRTEDTFKPIKAGRNLALSLDDVNRMSTYIAMRRQGFIPEEALKKVIDVHYDFGNLSDFERKWMRSIIPFYGWTRQNVPAIITQLMQQPGGKVGGSIRAASRARGGEPGFVPEYLGEGVAADVTGLFGDMNPGTKRFLSRLGLPFEDVGEMATGAGGFLGQLNPLLKAPLELMTGRQLWSGRDLYDLYGVSQDLFGRTVPPVDTLVANSPLGRPIRTLQTLADPRKGLGATAFNLLTGSRLTDVDMNRAAITAGRETIEDLLRGYPQVQNFDVLSVPEEAFSSLPEGAQQLYMAYRSLNRMARDAAQARASYGP